MKRTVAITAVAGMAALAITGTALAAAQSDPTTPVGLGASLTSDATADPTPRPGVGDTPRPGPTTGAPSSRTGLTRDEATKIALARVGGGQVTEIESELEHGFSTWKIEIVKSGVEHDIYVDRTTGTIIKTDTDRSDDRSSDDRGNNDDDGGGDRHGRGTDDHTDDQGRNR